MPMPQSLKTVSNLNLELPLVAAPVFLISGPDLALACCKEGIVGSFPALNQRGSEGFEAWPRGSSTPPNQRRKPGEINYGEKLKPMEDEAKAWKTIWSAGQGGRAR